MNQLIEFSLLLMDSTLFRLLSVSLMVASIQGQSRPSQIPKTAIEEFSCLSTNSASSCGQGSAICRFRLIGVPVDGTEGCKCQQGDIAWKKVNCRTIVRRCRGSSRNCSELLKTGVFCVFEAGKIPIQVFNGIMKSAPTFTHVMAGQCPRQVIVDKVDNPGPLILPPPLLVTSPNSLGTVFQATDPGYLLSCSLININNCSESWPKVCSENNGISKLYKNVCELCKQVPNAMSYRQMRQNSRCP